MLMPACTLCSTKESCGLGGGERKLNILGEKLPPPPHWIEPRTHFSRKTIYRVVQWQTEWLRHNNCSTVHPCTREVDTSPSPVPAKISMLKL